MNKVILIGNLTRDPELRTTPSGDSVCSFTIAVNRRRRSNAEAGQPEADFFRVSAWRQLPSPAAPMWAMTARPAPAWKCRPTTWSS